MLVHPSVQVFLADSLDVCFARNFHIMFSLSYVKAVVQGEEAKTFQWDCKMVVNEVKNLGASGFRIGGHSKIINLSKKQNSMVVHQS